MIPRQNVRSKTKSERQHVGTVKICMRATQNKKTEEDSFLKCFANDQNQRPNWDIW